MALLFFLAAIIICALFPVLKQADRRVWVSLPLLFCVTVAEAFADTSSSESVQAPSPEEPLVIVHQDVVVDTLSLKQLRSVFAMKQRFWAQDKPVTVFVLPKGHRLHSAFCKKILNIFPNQLESIWYRQVYTGTGQAPIEVPTREALLDRVSNTPGAIGYIDRPRFQQDEINNNNSDRTHRDHDIKILPIQ